MWAMGPFGMGRGPITERIQSTYLAAVRGNGGPEFEKWLTSID